jgi:lipoprotein-releasing system permease protein
MAWIEKQRNIIDFALSSLLRKVGKNLALLTVYAVIVFILASISFFTSAIKREAALVLKAGPEILVQRILAGRHDLIPESYIASMTRIPGVRGVKGRLWGYYFEPATGANYTLVVNGDNRLESGTVIIGRGVARTLNVQKGDLFYGIRWHLYEL